jgi:predicted nucleic acid-binding protein
MHEAFVDANVLLRFLTNEPREPADRAALLLEAAEERNVDLVVPALILAEVAYVLESVYIWPRTDIAARLLDLIGSEVFVVPERAAVIQSLLWYRDVAGIHFADAYLAGVAGDRGDACLLSLDRRLHRIPGIRLVQHPDELAD